MCTLDKSLLGTSLRNEYIHFYLMSVILSVYSAHHHHQQQQQQQ